MKVVAGEKASRKAPRKAARKAAAKTSDTMSVERGAMREPQRLPNGEMTRDWDVYVLAWRGLAYRIRRLIGMEWIAFGFDPGVLFTRTGGGPSLDVSGATYTAIMSAVARYEALLADATHFAEAARRGLCGGDPADAVVADRIMALGALEVAREDGG